MAQNSSHGRKKLSKQPSHADLLRPLSDSLSDALLLLDSNNRIVFANESAPKLLGRSRRSLLGNVVTNVMQLEDPVNSTPIKKLPSVRKSSAKVRAVLEPHRYNATLTCIRQLPSFNQIKNATTALILGPGSPSLANSANIQHQVIGQLAMRIAHDFNNSLTTIVGNAELIQEALEAISETDNPPSNINSSLQMVHDVIRKCRETTSFIRKLLDYAQREPDTKEEIDLNASLQNILPIIQKLLGPKLKTEFLPGTGLPQISIDESQLHQLLFIFVDNCKERVRTGTISIQTKQATLDENYANTHPGARPGAYLKVTITDNAPAIPAGSLPENFELFSAQTVDGAATGMRLAMIYAMLKHLRGYIHVESIEHIGNKFEIYLPLARITQQLHSMSAPVSTPTTGSKKRNRPNPRDPDSRPQDGAKVIIGTEAHAVDFVRGFISDRAEAQAKGHRLFQIAEKACGQWTDSHGRLSIFTHLYDAIRRDETGAYRSNEDRAAVIDKVLEQSAQWAEQLPQPAPEPTAEEIHEFTLALAEEAKHAQPQVEPEPIVVSEEAARDPHLLYVHELGSNSHGLATISDLTGLSSESFFHDESTNIDENQVYSDLFEHAIADAIEFNTPDHLALEPSPGGAALEATFDRVNLDALPPALPDGLSETNENYLIEELLPTIDAKIESGFTRSQILAPVYGDNRAQQAETLQQRVYNSGTPWVEGPPSREDQLNALSSLRLLIAGEYKHETRSFSREAIDWAKDNYRVNPDQLRSAGKLKVGEHAQIVSEQQAARTEWLHSHPGQQAPFRAQVAKINALETAGHKINTLIAALNPTTAELLRSLDTVQARIEAGKHSTEQRLTTFAQLEQQDVELQRAAQQYAHDTRTSNPFTALKATVDRNEHERQIDAHQELNRGNNARYEYLVSSGTPQVAHNHREGSGDPHTTTSFAMLQSDQAKERKTERARLLSHLVNPEIEAARLETAAALDKERRFFTQLAGREVQTSADARSAVEPALSSLTVVTKVADNTRARLDASAPAPVTVPESNDHIYVSLVSNEQLRVPIASAQEYNVVTSGLQECRFESSVWSSLHSPTPITGHDEERDAIANFVGDYVNFRLNDHATNQPCAKSFVS